jgi:pilus assembly protein CpaB
MRILCAALAVLLLTAGSGYYLLQGLLPAAQVVHAAEPNEASPPQAFVYVPASGLAAGAILTPEHLSRLALDPGAVTDEMIVADDAGRTTLVGSVARQALPQGVPIARSSVVQPGERGFLAAVLPQGKRAISISIGETAGLSGLVMPGDRVDIILTYSVAGASIDAARDVRASETVLSNLRVLALDQRLQEAAPPTGGAGTPPIARSATLEVTPRQAEMLTLATQLGDLSLVLNSVEDGGAESEILSERSLPRELTLDTQVTSLLDRHVQTEATEQGEARSLLAERMNQVQVVRGIQSQSMQLSAVPAASTAGAAGTADLVRAVNALATAPPPF